MENNLLIDNYAECQRALCDWLSAKNYKLFGTLIFNQETLGLAGMRLKLSELHKRVDRRLLGAKFSSKPASLRTAFVAFAEHLNTNPHMHLLITPPPVEAGCLRYELHAPIFWKKLCPSGEFNLQVLKTENDIQKVCGYALKECWKPENYSNFILSQEFLR